MTEGHPTRQLDEVEREYVERVLKFVGGRNARAADLLGIHPTTLWRKLERWKKDDVLTRSQDPPGGWARRNRWMSWRALDPRVLAVAVFNPEGGDWVAYIAPVAGKKHEQEVEGVARYGTKLLGHFAILLFHGVLARKNKEREEAGKPLYWWRD